MYIEERLFIKEYREMKLKVVSGIFLTLLLIGMLALVFNIQTTEAESTNSTDPSSKNDNEKPTHACMRLGLD